MTETREIRLDVNEVEVALLVKSLSYLAEDAKQQVVLYDLRSKVQLAWTGGMSDEDTALAYYAHELHQQAVLYDLREEIKLVWRVEVSLDDLALAAAILREKGRALKHSCVLAQGGQCLRIAEALCNAKL